MAEILPVADDPYLCQYKGFNFVKDVFNPEGVDLLEKFEVRDSDIFQVAYPKSGTIWMQQILSLICNENYRNGIENTTNAARSPWIESNFSNQDYSKRPSPRLFTSHLPYYLVPKDLRNRRGKVIYVARNPKDVMASFYHFEHMISQAQESPNFEHFLKKYLAGHVFAGTWFDHVRGWYANREDFNFLFITYEELILDLRSAVIKICKFLGKQLDDQELDKVVKQSTFKSMKVDPKTNAMPGDFFKKDKENFFRKGTIGDWKNIMTVAQSEMIDKIYQEKMGDLPIKFIFDIPWESQA